MQEFLQHFEGVSDTSFSMESFESLVYPRTQGEFFSQSWEQRPFFTERNATGYFDQLLRLDDVDSYVGTRTFHEADIRLAMQGKDLFFKTYSKGGVVDREKLLLAFKDGATVIFSHLNRHHLPLADYLSVCEIQTHVPMRSNVYLSPPGARGFNAHWDTHDVIVLQISGSKRWHLFESPYRLPHEDQKRKLRGYVESAKKVGEVLLRPGSVLYLPRGFIHAAESEDEHSLHITLGMRTLTIADVLLRAFRETSLEHEQMRTVVRLTDSSVPGRSSINHAILRSIIRGMDIKGAAEDVYRSFIRNRRVPVEGALMRRIHRPALNHEQRMRMRSDVLYHIFDNHDRLSLAVDGIVVDLPIEAKKVIHFIESVGEFTPESLPDVEYNTKVILANTLLDCRFLELVL